MDALFLVSEEKIKSKTDKKIPVSRGDFFSNDNL